MLKLKAKDNVLAMFLRQQNLPERELNFLKSCGSDNLSVYLHNMYLTDLIHIQSTSIQTIHKRLRDFKSMTPWQFFLLWIMIFAQFFPIHLWSHIQPYLPDGFQTYLWTLVAIYLCAEVLVWFIKQRQHPQTHYQLTLHTRFGEQYVFAKAESKDTLLLLEAWLQNHPSHSKTSVN
ncbi:MULTISPECIES: hypothetical protein [Vitreoscilla]|uniref:DUF1003 domain-containing protein n=1 Tax=Vitreoscilla stercoraria TaxID=61 RepID=A0ABY4E7L9_VITST|nr:MULTISPECIES: hypothetical protein [Vitreoscilla]AUZ04526.1 hypothetical protein ADP71_07750 [Vitreoscilla sp. C1]UOO91763.1 hypothetical protein LVJ81_08980 [Vitreoscilla stercoraria]